MRMTILRQVVSPFGIRLNTDLVVVSLSLDGSKEIVGHLVPLQATHLLRLRQRRRQSVLSDARDVGSA